MNLDFLNNVKLEEVATKTKISTKIIKLPVDADLRVFSNGSIYPSESFAKDFDLEYRNKEVVVEGGEPEIVGNGLDVFSSLKWGMIQGKLPKELLFVSAVAKTAPKADLWANTKYDGDVPKASVFTQGCATFGKNTLLQMITDVYGIDFSTVDYVDLSVVRDQTVSHPSGIYNIPKTVASGKNKGKDTYIRRNNIDIYPLVLSENQPEAEVKEETITEITSEPAVETPDMIENITQDSPPVEKVEEAVTNDTSTPEPTSTEDLFGDVETPAEDPGDDWAAKLGNM